MAWCSWKGPGRSMAVHTTRLWDRWRRFARPGIALPGLALAGLAACGGAAGLDAPGAASISGQIPGTENEAGGSPASAPAPPAEPGDIIAAFLDAANHRDHAAMARLFGTAAGPVGEPGSAVGCGLRRLGSWMGLGQPCVTAQEIELRMDVIARILAHESHRAGPVAPVAGRGRPAARVEVEMAVRSGELVRVPFVLILAEGHGWLVEQVGLERLTK